MNENDSALIVGPTRIGKTSFAIQARLEDLRAGKSILWADTQPMASGFQFYKAAIEAGLDDRVIFDDLDDYQFVVPHNFLIPAPADDPAREQLDKKTVELFLDQLAVQRGFGSMTSHVLIRQYGEPWAYLMMYQNPRKPLAFGKFAFKPGTREHVVLCKECEHADAAQFFEHIPRHAATLTREAGPALRFLDVVLNGPAVNLRDGLGQGFALGSWFANGGSYVIQGGERITWEELRFLIRGRVLESIRWKQERSWSMS